MRALKWNEFSRHIARQRPAGCYAFCGPEAFLKSEALDAMKRALVGEAGGEARVRYAVETFRVGETSVREMVTVVSQTGLFGGDRMVLIENAEKLSRASRKDREIWMELVKTGSANPVVFLSHRNSKELGGRSSFVAGLLRRVQVVEFWHLYPRDAVQWIGRRAETLGLQLTRDAATHLVSRLGTDLHLLSREIEKISLMHGKGRLGVQELKKMVRAGILGSSWDCIDALLRGDIGEAIERLQGVRQEEASFSFLWKLTSSASHALEGRGGQGAPSAGGWSQGRATDEGRDRGQDAWRKRMLAELLQGCYEWESRLKGGRWSGNHDFVALEGLMVGRALLSQRLRRPTA